MEIISGRAADYGLDREVSSVTRSVTPVYNELFMQDSKDQMSFLASLTPQQRQEHYPKQNERINFLRVMTDELDFERQYLYRKMVLNPLKKHGSDPYDLSSFDKIPF